MSFPTVYETTRLNEHPFLAIFESWTDFSSGQGVGGMGQKNFGLKTLPYWWVITVYGMKVHACVVWPKRLNK